MNLLSFRSVDWANYILYAYACYVWGNGIGSRWLTICLSVCLYSHQAQLSLSQLELGNHDWSWSPCTGEYDPWGSSMRKVVESTQTPDGSLRANFELDVPVLLTWINIFHGWTWIEVFPCTWCFSVNIPDSLPAFSTHCSNLKICTKIMKWSISMLDLIWPAVNIKY